MNNLLLVISGPSGAGKDTLIRELLKREKKIKLSISCTTRSKRKGEVDGYDYFFKTKQEFKKLIKEGKLIEYAKIGNEYYGSPVEFIEKNFNKGYDVILEIDTQGAMQIKKKFNEAILIFIATKNLEELRKRLVRRNTEEEQEIVRRLKLAKKEMKFIPHYDYLIVNDNLNEAVNKLHSVIIAERARVKRWDLKTKKSLLE